MDTAIILQRGNVKIKVKILKSMCASVSTRAWSLLPKTTVLGEKVRQVLKKFSYVIKSVRDLEF